MLAPSLPPWLLAALVSASLCAWGGGVASDGAPVDVVFVVLTDVGAPADGAHVRARVVGAEEGVALVASEAGTALGLRAREGERVEFVLDERRTGEGVFVGRAVAVDVPRFPDPLSATFEGGELYFRVYRTQTLAVPVRIGGREHSHEVWAEGRTSRWSLHVPAGVPEFHAFGAPLVSGHDVATTLAYHGHVVGEDAYALGVALRLDAPLREIGPGLVVQLSGPGALELGKGGASADVFGFGDEAGDLDVGARVLGRDRDAVLVHVTGALPAGWTIVAVRTGRDSRTVAAMSTPPAFAAAQPVLPAPPCTPLLAGAAPDWQGTPPGVLGDHPIDMANVGGAIAHVACIRAGERHVQHELTHGRLEFSSLVDWSFAPGSDPEEISLQSWGQDYVESQGGEAQCALLALHWYWAASIAAEPHVVFRPWGDAGGAPRFRNGETAARTVATRTIDVIASMTTCRSGGG